MVWWGGLAAGAAAVAGVLLLARGAALITAWLLVATAVAVALVVGPVPDSDLGFTVFLLVAGPGIQLCGMLGVLAGYTWPMAPPRRRARLVAVAALGSVVLLGSVAPLLLFDPASAGCNDCPRNLADVFEAPAVSDVLQRFSTVLTLGWAPVLAVLTAAGWLRATRLGRRQGFAILCGTVGLALLTTVAAARALRLPIGALDDVQYRLWSGECVMLTVLALGVVAQRVVAQATAARMAGRVSAAIPEPSTVQTWLRDSVGDPQLTVTFVRDDSVRVDADGIAVTAGDTRPVVQLTRDGAVFADVRSQCRSTQELDLVRGCARSAGLALEYVAARARLRSEVRESAAVRARIVAAGDRERRRLERNLHDGAQQQLVALAVLLASRARSRTDAEVAAYHHEIDAALAELRTVARGLFPASLGEGDLDGALRELGDHTQVPLLVRNVVTHDIPLPVAMAIYRLVLDASRIAPPASVLHVALEQEAESPAGDIHVTVTVAGDNEGAGDGSARVPVQQPALLHAEDRFVALGGRLVGVVRPGCLEWEGTVPCA